MSGPSSLPWESRCGTGGGETGQPRAEQGSMPAVVCSSLGGQPPLPVWDTPRTARSLVAGVLEIWIGLGMNLELQFLEWQLTSLRLLWPSSVDTAGDLGLCSASIMLASIFSLLSGPESCRDKAAS